MDFTSKSIEKSCLATKTIQNEVEIKRNQVKSSENEVEIRVLQAFQHRFVASQELGHIATRGRLLAQGGKPPGGVPRLAKHLLTTLNIENP